MYIVMDQIAQTFFFGVYTLLMSLSTRMLVKRGLKNRTNKIMLLVTLFMYLLSAAFWSYGVVYAADKVQAQIEMTSQSSIPDHDNITQWSPLFNAVVMINFVLSDGVVVWRAWVISHRDLRKYLWVTMGFLALTAVAVFVLIGFRITAFIQSPIDDLSKNNFLRPAIDILQISTGVLSLVSNLSATAVVGITALRHRRILRDAFTDEAATTRADQLLALIVEAGAVYCLSTAIVLVSAFIRLPHGTFGDLYGPINVHVAGAYPPVVILLVSMNRSLDETAFLDTVSPARPMEFSSANTSPTTTVGGPEMITLPEKSRRKPVQSSRFSDDSFETRYVR